MAPNRAVVVDPDAPGHLAICVVEEPQPRPNEAVVRVSAISLNPGEVRRAQNIPAGTRIGYDVAGTVEIAAANSSGPAVGERVLGVLTAQNAWAERVAVPTGALAPLPKQVSFAQAATLPIAGLTALYALRKGGTLLGERVLITGATGGVGHFAIQLARDAGAMVVGLVRRAAHVEMVQSLGAHQVAVDETGAAAAAYGPYHLVLDAIGGPVLATALSALAPGGTCVSFGAAAGASFTLQSRDFFRAGRTTLYGFLLFPELGAEPARHGLAILANLVADGRLRPQIEVEAPWTSVGEIAEQLLDRAYVGKAVLHIE